MRQDRRNHDRSAVSQELHQHRVQGFLGRKRRLHRGPAVENTPNTFQDTVHTAPFNPPTVVCLFTVCVIGLVQIPDTRWPQQISSQAHVVKVHSRERDPYRCLLHTHCVTADLTRKEPHVSERHDSRACSTAVEPQRSAHPGGRSRSSRGRSSGGRKVRKAGALPRMAGRLSSAHSRRSVLTAHLSVAAFLPLAKHALRRHKHVQFCSWKKMGG